MWTVRILCVVLVWALPATAQEPSRKEVRAAVSRAVGWLRKAQGRGGAFGSQPGETALALMALRHSGVPASDPACLHAAKRLERDLPDGQCYSAALGTLALLAQSPERHRKTIRKLVDSIVRGQCKNGQWSYKLRRSGRRKEGDNSNTQIAVLALSAARARGVAVPTAPFTLLRRHLRDAQNADGGFGYTARSERSYASMTAGCAMALALCLSVEKRKPSLHADVRSDRGVQRAYAWLARDFRPGVNRGAGVARSNKRKQRNDNHWRHYWLWSLERACGSTATRRLGEHDWYAEGAQYLLQSQRRDGNWKDPEERASGDLFRVALSYAADRRHHHAARPGPRYDDAHKVSIELA